MQKIITHRKQLVEYFLNSSTPEQMSKIGGEFEKLGVFKHSKEAISYTGKKGVAAVLSGLSQRYGWEPIREEGSIIGLFRGTKNITLEPGGQIELSGSPLDNVHQVKKEVEEHLREIKSISEPLGIKWLGLGMQPVSKLKDIQWVPKNRYRIMVPYMEKHGKLSHYMMKKTASIQVNLDYLDEEDFSTKMGTALKLVPIITAIFANSPVSEGKLNGFLSKRACIWNYTDPARCHLINKRFFLKPRFSSYVDYALDVPMFFILRDEGWIEVKNTTFSKYLKEGYQGYRATLDDWELHLSTIFTEVRVRSYIEIRNADCQRMELLPAIPALWKGILYSKNSLAEVLSLLKGVSWENICELYRVVPHQGLRTKIEKVRLLDLAKEILKIARAGLKEQEKLNDKGEDESIYLAQLMQLLIEDELCPAEVIIKNWKGSWHASIDKLIEYSSY
ncbi:glutamate--cysteine ligase [Candidatus Aerophobetes bacterium]|nr:glutamate--cysteine ligase [Candidatus Aerophobetes bacterium]